MKIKIGANTVSVSDAVFAKHKNRDSFAKEMIKIHPHITGDNIEDHFKELYDMVNPKKDDKIEGVGK